MKVLVFESNLMWSSKLAQTLRGFGHEPVLLSNAAEIPCGAQAAIINLGQPTPDPAELSAKLKAAGVPVIAHAGHKEKELMELGRSLNVDVLTTNSELTNKLPDILASLQQ